MPALEKESCNTGKNSLWYGSDASCYASEGYLFGLRRGAYR